MSNQDIAVTIPVAIVWTLIFTFAILLLVGWTIGSIHPLIAILAGGFCAIGWLRIRGVI